MESLPQSKHPDPQQQAEGSTGGAGGCLPDSGARIEAMPMKDASVTPDGSILLIGVGNPYRSDDGLGPCVAHEFQRRAIPHVTVVEESGEGAALMQRWRGAHAVLLVDAMCSSEPYGSLHRFDVSTSPLPRSSFQYSTHAFGLVEGVEMARELKQLPPTLIVYGIVGQSFASGEGLSDPVVKAVPGLLAMIERDITLLGG